MATMNISVTDPMRAWVEAKVSEGEYATASDCMRDLLRERIDYEVKLEALKMAVREGRESGPSPMSWQEILEEARERVTRRKIAG